MRVLVTGGTGFVGCHIVAALVQAGHTVRLLVRDRDKTQASLRPFGADVVAAAQQDVVVGDVLDPQAVRDAVNGCDAVVHAAAIYSLDPRRSAEIQRTNVDAAENVLGEAVRARLSPVVHISTYAVLVRKAAPIRRFRWVILTIPTRARKSSRSRWPAVSRRPETRW